MDLVAEEETSESATLIYFYRRMQLCVCGGAAIIRYALVLSPCHPQRTVYEKCTSIIGDHVSDFESPIIKLQ